MNELTKKIIVSVVLLAVACLSFFVVAQYASAPENHKHTIESLDKKQTTVLELTATTTTTAFLISCLPDDKGSTVAQKISDLSTYLMVVLCAIFLEKYLVTIFGYATFKLLIPIACVMFMIYVFWKNESLKQLASKIVVLGLALYLLVPSSVFISDLIESTYDKQIQASIEEAKKTELQLGSITSSSSDEEKNTDSKTEDSKDKGWFESATDAVNNVVDNVKDTVSNVTEYLENAMESLKTNLNNMLEAVAVMIITTCVIPVVVLLFFVWLVKIILEVDIFTSSLSKNIPKIKKVLSNISKKAPKLETAPSEETTDVLVFEEDNEQ